jgi:hypothetical protein
MKIRRTSVFSVVALLFASASLWSAGQLEGRWLLMEQTYGSAGSNMIAGEPEVRIEFRREGAGIAARTWRGDGSEGIFRWPSMLTGDGTDIRVEEIIVAPEKGLVRARYRTDSDDDDEVAVEIIEEYRVGEDGDTLTGTVTVSRVRGDEPRGSYVLHRRFVREP